MNNNYNNYNADKKNGYSTQPAYNNSNFNNENCYGNNNNYQNHNPEYINCDTNSMNSSKFTSNYNYKNSNNHNNYNASNSETQGFVPNCGYGNPANITTSLPLNKAYNPLLTEQEFKKQNKIEAERRSLRNTSNKIGVGLFIFTILSNVITFLFMFPLIFTKVIDITNSNYTNGIEPVSLYILNAIVCLLGFSIAGIITTKISKLRLDDVIKIKKTNIADTTKFVLAGMGFTFILNILLAFMNMNLSLFGYTNEMSDYGEVNGIAGNIIYFVSIAIVPAIIEEFLFRGVILGTLRKYHGDVIAIIVSSVLFGFIHGNFLQTPLTALSGMIMGYLAVKTGSIIPSMILHFVNNALAVTSEWLMKAIDNEYIYSIVDTTILLAFIVVGFICAISLIKKYKNDLFKFDKPETELIVSKKLTYIFTAPCMIIFTLYTVIICFYNATSV